jgi:isoleucyl-tRNA synthetase
VSLNTDAHGKTTPVAQVAFVLDDDPDDAQLVAWTTTPWTLPSNLALCVNPDFDYVKVSAPPSSAPPWPAARVWSSQDVGSASSTMEIRKEPKSLAGDLVNTVICDVQFTARRVCMGGWC